MHQFDMLYMPSDTLYGNKYKYILAGIDAASRYKVTIGPLTYPSTFQCNNGSKFKGEVNKMLEKHEVKIR